LGRWAGAYCKWNFFEEILLLDEVVVYPGRGQIVLFAANLGISPEVNDPGSLGRIGKLLRNADRVVLASPPERRKAWKRILRGTGVNVEVLTPELDELGALEMRQFHGRFSALIAAGPLGLRGQMAKRAFDLAVTIPALVLLAPVLGAVALAVKLESRGPVLFRQPRIGYANSIFEVLKFRSMRVDQLDTNANTLTQIGDSRVTRVGSFIRKTSLDELPQLINVLRGEMSLVGPRPHALGALAGDALYWDIDHSYFERHAMKPGLTGLAQVRGHRGTTFEREDLVNRLGADLEYLSNWTIWRDIRIIFATIRVLTHRNAF
jgi:lipopolysaccharide/colanic/teichoic acid biosynthesis glycosyltransferase